MIFRMIFIGFPNIQYNFHHFHVVSGPFLPRLRTGLVQPIPWRRKAESTASAESTAARATAEMREAMVSSDGKKTVINRINRINRYLNYR